MAPLVWQSLPAPPRSNTPCATSPVRRPHRGCKNIYGGTFNLLRHTLPRDGITTTFVSAENPQEFEDAIQENTKLVYFETFGNPTPTCRISKPSPPSHTSIICR